MRLRRTGAETGQACPARLIRPSSFRTGPSGRFFYAFFYANTDPVWALATLCRSVYDPRRDDADFRRSLVGTVEEQRKAFDLLRKHYPDRREIDGLKVRINGESPALSAIVAALGAQKNP